MNTMRKPEGRYLVPAAQPGQPHQTRLVIKKSLFLTQSCHCQSAAGAREFVAAIKAANPDASHNCWAFTALPPGRVGLAASSDDGEPHGTAGRPMLQCLLGSGFGEICMVVSRWFGGVKLGTGGLVKAYQQAALENLATLPGKEKISYGNWRLVVDYGTLESVKKYFQEIGARIEMEEYGASANLVIGVPEDMAHGLAAAIARLSNGRAMLAPLELNQPE